MTMGKLIISDQSMSLEFPTEQHAMSRITRMTRGEDFCLITLTHTDAT